MKNKHDHVECSHEKLKYCKSCQLPYCLDCGKEWRQFQWNSYPNYLYTYDNNVKQYAGSGSSTQANLQTVTPCSHESKQ